MREAVQAAVHELALFNPNGASLSAIADQVSADRREVTSILKELREEAVIIKTGRLYRMNPEYGNKQPASNDAEAYDRLTKNGTDTSALSEPFTICNLEDFEPEHPAISAIYTLQQDLEELDARRNAPAIADKELKLEVLARLSLILADDVGEVLNRIAEDLEAV